MYDLYEDLKLECPECGYEAEKNDLKFNCPFCGETDNEDGFYICESCGTLFDYTGDPWECDFCDNERPEEETEEETCPQCGEVLEDVCCDNCGWPNNQGWLGEEYG